MHVKGRSGQDALGMLGNIADSQATLTKAEEQLKEWWSQEPNRMQITVEDLFELCSILGLKEKHELMTEFKEDVLLGALMMSLGRGDAGVFSGLGTSRGQTCGKVFKRHELVYRCKTCGVDDTCVMCAECYHASDHEGHNVFFNVSGGNGCCDCGDLEAWKVPVRCTIHQTTEDTSIDPGLKAHLTDTIRTIMRFVVVILRNHTRPTITDADSLPSTAAVLPPPLPTTSGHNHLAWGPNYYGVTVYNDEHHTFNEVIAAFQAVRPSPSMSGAQAGSVAVDQHGRDTLLKTASLDSAWRVWRFLAVNHTLRSSVARWQQLLCEEAVVILLDGILQLCKQNQILRGIFCSVLVESDDTEDIGGDTYPYIMFLLNDSGFYWKRARAAIRDLFFYSLLLEDVRYKKALAVCFARSYSDLVEYYMNEDEDPDFSNLHIALQLLTTPSVLSFIVDEHDLLKTLMDAILRSYRQMRTMYETEYTAITGDRRFLLGEGLEQTERMSDRLRTVVHDLRYVISKSVVQQSITKDTRHLDLFIDFLRSFQGIDPQKRMITTHVLYDNLGWLNVFQMIQLISRILPLFAQSFLSLEPQDCEVALDRTLRIVTGEVADSEHEGALVETVTMTSTRTGAQPQAYRMSVLAPGTPLSLHHPLHWLFAHTLRVFLTLPKAAGLPDLRFVFEGARPMNDRLLSMVDAPLNTFLLQAQVYAGMWRRNGMSMNLMVTNYRGALRDTTFMQDLYLMQVAAALLDTEHFLTLLLSRFQLASYFGGQVTMSIDPAHVSILAEELLQLLVSVLNDRWLVGDCPPGASLRQLLIQALVARPLTHSQLSALDSEASETPLFETILNEIATFRPPVGTEAGRYQLKEEFLHMYDPFTLLMRREERERAAESVRQNASRASYTFTAARPIPFLPQFAPIRRLFSSNLMIQIVHMCLVQASPQTTMTPSDPPSSATLLDLGVHLIVLGLADQGAFGDIPDAPSSFANALILNEYEPARVRSPTDGAGSADERWHCTVLDLLLEMARRPAAAGANGRVEWSLARLRELATGAALEALRSKELIGDDSESQSMDAEAAAQAKKTAAKKRQADILLEFANRQKSFMAANQAMFEEIENDDLEDDLNTPVHLIHPIAELKMDVCILCTEPSDRPAQSKEGDAASEQGAGVLTFMQTSRMIRAGGRLDATTTAASAGGDYEGLDCPWIPPMHPSDSGGEAEPLFPPDDCKVGKFVSSCGHYMHAACYKTFVKSRIPRMSGLLFACPLCKTPGNGFLSVSSKSFECTAEIPDRPFRVALGGILDAYHVAKASSPLGGLSPAPSAAAAPSADALSSSPSSSSAASAPRPSSSMSFLERLVHRMRHGNRPAGATGGAAAQVAEDTALDETQPSSDTVDRVQVADVQPVSTGADAAGPAGGSPAGATTAPQRRRSSLAMILDPFSAAVEALLGGEFSPGKREPSIQPKQFEAYAAVYEYTMEALEVALRGHDTMLQGCFAEALTRQQLLTLRAAQTTLSATLTSADVVHYVDQRFGRLLVSWFASFSERDNPFEVSPLRAVLLASVAPAASTVGILNVVRLSVLSQIAKVLLNVVLSLDAVLDDHTDEPPPPGPNDDEEALFQYLAQVVAMSALGHRVAAPAALSETVWRFVLPTLRQLSLFVYAHLGYPSTVPGELLPSEVVKLQQYLKLGSITQLIVPDAHEDVINLFRAWSRRGARVAGFERLRVADVDDTDDASDRASSVEPEIPTFGERLSFYSTGVLEGGARTGTWQEDLPSSHKLPHPYPYYLLPLPNRYDVLLKDVNDVKCDICGKVSKDPALCLICGVFVCSYQTFCKDVEKSGVNEHATMMHGGTALYHTLGQVSLIHDIKHSIIDAPYVDSHGEPDPLLRRGRPLFLQEKRAAELRSNWLQHKIALMADSNVAGSL